jgi:hypothetical protein
MMAQANQQAKPNLQPSPLKLVVMQRVVPDDPGSVPQNPRLGAVSINLAEYVGKGKVERRFLLKESKVNATLKVSAPADCFVHSPLSIFCFLRELCRPHSQPSFTFSHGSCRLQTVY